MEGQHHPNLEKKNFKEYFLGFFMMVGHSVIY